VEIHEGINVRSYASLSAFFKLSVGKHFPIPLPMMQVIWVVLKGQCVLLYELFLKEHYIYVGWNDVEWSEREYDLYNF